MTFQKLSKVGEAASSVCSCSDCWNASTSSRDVDAVSQDGRRFPFLRMRVKNVFILLDDFTFGTVCVPLVFWSPCC